MTDKPTDVPLITLREIIAGAPRQWRSQYFRGGEWKHGDDKRLIGERLAALSPPTKEEVDAIIGNDSWTQCKCDHCKQDVDAVALMGEEPDWESATARVCITCLRRAVTALEGQ